jgi:hypothetical protein
VEFTSGYTFLPPVWDLLLALTLKYKESRFYVSFKRRSNRSKVTCPRSQTRWSVMVIEPTIFEPESDTLTLSGWRSTFVTKIRMQKILVIFTTLLKPHHIGIHLKGIETSVQEVLLFLKSFHFWMSSITFWNFLKIPSVFKGLTTRPCCPSNYQAILQWGNGRLHTPISRLHTAISSTGSVR